MLSILVHIVASMRMHHVHKAGAMLVGAAKTVNSNMTSICRSPSTKAVAGTTGTAYHRNDDGLGLPINNYESQTSRGSSLTTGNRLITSKQHHRHSMS